MSARLLECKRLYSSESRASLGQPTIGEHDDAALRRAEAPRSAGAAVGDVPMISLIEVLVPAGGAVDGGRLPPERPGDVAGETGVHPEVQLPAVSVTVDA
jgi:hypothetical protein